MHILIVDDEVYIRELVAKYLKHESFESSFASNGEEAVEMVRNNNYDLVIMDIMMPVLDGFSAVKEIRKFSDVPVIMLSARSEEYDKVYGFDLGIDDYVTKPFSPKELLMRIKAVTNRFNRAKDVELKEKAVFIYKTLKVDFDARRVFISEVEVELTHKEYELLVLLIQNVDNAVTREKLVETVWDSSISSDDRTLDTHIKSLRKKILEYSDNIITIRRVGYRFEVK
ncbi:MAG: response regulator transcription factor [Erysipelotrichaceae bacterium]|nr:response regulator transcription factor [Erysipelotrichaceae bacterium]